MKKQLFISILFMFICINVSSLAQDALKKGVYSLSGGFSFSSSTNTSKWEEVKSLDILISPTLNYFLIDNLSAGVSLALGYYELTFEDSYRDRKYINRPISLGGNVRYYFSNEKFIPFVEAGYRYGNSLQGNEDMNTLTLACGVNYFLTKCAAIEPYLEYRKMSYIEANQKTSSIAFGVRFNYFILD